MKAPFSSVTEIDLAGVVLVIEDAFMAAPIRGSLVFASRMLPKKVICAVTFVLENKENKVKMRVASCKVRAFWTKEPYEVDLGSA